MSNSFEKYSVICGAILEILLVLCSFIYYSLYVPRGDKIFQVVVEGLNPVLFLIHTLSKLPPIQYDYYY